MEYKYKLYLVSLGKQSLYSFGVTPYPFPTPTYFMGGPKH